MEPELVPVCCEGRGVRQGRSQYLPAQREPLQRVQLRHPGSPAEAKLTRHIRIQAERWTLKTWLPQLLGLTRRNYAEQASRLGSQAGFPRCFFFGKQSVCFFAGLQLFARYAGSPTFLKVARCKVNLVQTIPHSSISPSVWENTEHYGPAGRTREPNTLGP